MMSVSTNDDGTDNSLPSFSTFSSELDPAWEFYDQRDRSNGGITDVISSVHHPQHHQQQHHNHHQQQLHNSHHHQQQQNNAAYTRPWEMETKDKGFEPFSKLPSFQSQFQSYSETVLVSEPSLPHIITPVPVPVSPSSQHASIPPANNGSSLTQLTPIQPMQSAGTGVGGVGGNGLTTLSTPSFHTLTAVNTRTYPLVPAPIQARDIPAINHQYLEERHIQLYQPITTTTTPISTYAPQSPMQIKSESASGGGGGGGIGLGIGSGGDYFDVKNGLHHSNFINPLISNGFEVKQEKPETPKQRHTDARKKERRKNRASSLESSAESDGSAMDMGDGNPGQVAAISSTASFKSPMSSMSMCDDMESSSNGEKQVSFI